MKIYLISSTVLANGIDQFLADRFLAWERQDISSDPERVVEFAGRVCYMSFGEKQYRRNNAEYVENLISQGHGSVLEHANFTLLIDGVSRALTHQLVRHRVGFAYSQLSQQYHDESDTVFVEPAMLAENPEALSRWNAHVQQARELYKFLLNEGVIGSSESDLNSKELQRFSRSIARSVLPNAAATTLVVTGNARAWRHLLNTRGSILGDAEMRSYCVEILKTLSAIAPNLFADFELKGDQLGEFVQMRTM